MYSCKILLDSITFSKNRLTTFELTYPRFVHSEMMTHRVFSRNSASSRAIPTNKMLQKVKENPALPIHWGANQKGMQAEQELSPEKANIAKKNWLEGRDAALKVAENLLELGVHKQVANRVLEPYVWITVILSGTDFDNFFDLRCNPSAQPEIQKIAYMMRDIYFSNKPYKAEWGYWHTPLISLEEMKEFSLEDRKKISVGRCARVSYLTHDGKRDPQADIDLYYKLKESGHWSPFEHVAKATDVQLGGNFKGWQQYRKQFVKE